MARRNKRGLELSFKRYGGGRRGGRWYTRVGGKPVYYGTSAIGVSDRASYEAALSKYKADQRTAEQQATWPQQMADMSRLFRIVTSGDSPTGDDLEFCLALTTYTEAEKQALRAYDQGNKSYAPHLLAMAQGQRLGTTASDKSFSAPSMLSRQSKGSDGCEVTLICDPILKKSTPNTQN
jgi:hypothetical protein